MTQRSQARNRFVEQRLGRPADSIEPASEDASFRSYWRVKCGPASFILMDAPPEHEDCGPFVAIQARLAAARLHPPAIHASDLDEGFLLLEDLGDTLFADLLDEQSAENLYGQAFRILETMATMETTGLPRYDAELLGRDLALFPEWFVARQLGRPVDEAFLGWWGPLCEQLLESALMQPQVFVHRDFHCGNLMPGPAQPAVLDFQDAVAGPITYDLISLLQDRYISWPRERLLAWAEAHRRRVAPGIRGADWKRQLDWMGLQRNLKIVGIFARLNLRDGKPRYLDWQPRFAAYVRDVAERYPEFEELATFMQSFDLAAGRDT